MREGVCVCVGRGWERVCVCAGRGWERVCVCVGRGCGILIMVTGKIDVIDYVEKNGGIVIGHKRRDNM